MKLQALGLLIFSEVGETSPGTLITGPGALGKESMEGQVLPQTTRFAPDHL